MPCKRACVHAYVRACSYLCEPFMAGLVSAIAQAGMQPNRDYELHMPCIVTSTDRGIYYKVGAWLSVCAHVHACVHRAYRKHMRAHEGVGVK